MTQQPAFNAYGAVDLGALAARSPRATGAATSASAAPAAPGARAGAPTDGAGGAVVVDVTEATFEALVVQQSRTVPVVLDFWADWCGPCKQLSPVLERLAQDDGGRWVLAKIDVDAQPRLSAAFQIQSIPSVFAVIAGQPVPLFQGAVPEPQVRQVLDELLALAAQHGVRGTVSAADAGGTPGGGSASATDVEALGEAGDPELDAAYEAIERGDYEAAAAAYRNLLAMRPGDPTATAGLAQVDLLRRTAELDPAVVRRAADADPADVGAQSDAADLDLLDGRVEDAFARLVEAVRRSAGPDRDRARTRLLELFDVVGADDPRVGDARRALSAALF